MVKKLHRPVLARGILPGLARSQAISGSRIAAGGHQQRPLRNPWTYRGDLGPRGGDTPSGVDRR
jgi:hypothetical protein